MLVGAVGLAVGALTSFGQTYLGGTLNAFVNSASAWLIAPFLLGRLMSTRGGAAAAGLAVALNQLVGYYLTAHLRGYPPGGAIVLFWVACALMGGPLFGAGGHLSRYGTLQTAGLGSMLLPASFLAEGLWVYLHQLRYDATAALWVGIGLALCLLIPADLRECRWLPFTLVLATVGEIVISHIYRQAF